MEIGEGKGRVATRNELEWSIKNEKGIGNKLQMRMKGLFCGSLLSLELPAPGDFPGSVFINSLPDGKDEAFGESF